MLPSALTNQAMAKLTKAILTKKIQERTGLSRRKAQKGLKEVLDGIKTALQAGKAVQFPGVGRLVVVERPRKRVIRKNMKGRCPSSVVELHKKHPKSVRLVGGKDLSDDPQPTIVHKKHKKEEPEPAPARLRHIAIAFPAWRRRHRFR
jgi:nucleoid DNA-binding protein